MKFTNISKFIIKFMGGGKINFPFNYLKEVEINGDNDGEGGGDGESGGFDLDTFKQNIVDIYNKNTDTPITTDNIIMPDAFIINDGNPGAPHFTDADLMQFLSSSSIGIPTVFPLYLKDSFDQNNVYFGSGKSGNYKLAHRDGFNSERNFDGMSDDSYNGNLDLSNYINLLDVRGIG